MHGQAGVKAPRHLWIVGVLSLIWNGFGAFDYLMTNTRNADYIAQFPAEMMQIIDAFPLWVMAAWAIGVWGGLVGSILLLARSRLAVSAFVLSLLGLAGSTFYQFGIDLPEAMKTAGMNAMTLAIWLVAVILLLYSIRMRGAGVLK